MMYPHRPLVTELSAAGWTGARHTSVYLLFGFENTQTLVEVNK
jgi:hypothetical protein